MFVVQAYFFILLNLANAFPPICASLFDSKKITPSNLSLLSQHYRQYQDSLQIYKKLNPSSGESLLRERVLSSEQPTVEVLSFLDAHSPKQNVFSQFQAVIKLSEKEFLLKKIKEKKGNLLVSTSAERIRKDLYKFIKNLLISLHHLEMKRAETLTLKFKENNTIEHIYKTDTFFYENNAIFSRYINLHKNDALSAYSSGIANLIFSMIPFVDPIQKHRLNLKDLSHFQSKTLEQEIYRRLYATKHSRKIFWASILTIAIIQPMMNYSNIESILTYTKEAHSYLVENKDIIQNRLENNIRKSKEIRLLKEEIKNKNLSNQERQEKLHRIQELEQDIQQQLKIKKRT